MFLGRHFAKREILGTIAVLLYLLEWGPVDRAAGEALQPDL